MGICKHMYLHVLIYTHISVKINPKKEKNLQNSTGCYESGILQEKRNCFYSGRKGASKEEEIQCYTSAIPALPVHTVL